MKKRILFCIILLLYIPVTAFASGFTTDVAAINEAAKSVLMLEVYQDDALIGTGSGFVVGNNRMLVTNHHVIEGGNAIIGYSDDGYSYLLTKVFAADAEQDLAILGFMSPTNLTPLTLSTDSVFRAEPVVAIGSPQGMLNTVSMGNVSGFVTIDNVDCIQFTAPISNGSSGGALFNDRGEVIGVTTSAIAPNGNVVQNLNFAVNASTVIALLDTVNEADAVSLASYASGVLPGPTPEPTPEPSSKPTPTLEPSNIQAINLTYNYDGTATLIWTDTSSVQDSEYFFSYYINTIANRRSVELQPSLNPDGFFECTVPFMYYPGSCYVYAIANSTRVAESMLDSYRPHHTIHEQCIGIYSAVPQEAEYSKYPAIAYGETGESVKKLQNALIRYQYLSGKADGIFGQATALAVFTFCERYGLQYKNEASSLMQLYLFEGETSKNYY